MTTGVSRTLAVTTGASRAIVGATAVWSSVVATTDGDAGALFDRLSAAVEARAAASSACLVERFWCAGTVVEIRSFGAAALAWTSTAFGAAIERDACDVALRIDVASGPDVLPEIGAGVSGGETPGPVVSDARHVVHVLPALVAGLDRAQSRVVALLRGVAELPHVERVKPLATLLSVWCHDQGVRVVHAGMTARDGDGVLFVGPSGSGKSTASLACLAAGLDFLGDDVIGLRTRDDGGFDGVRLYATATLEQSHLERAVLVGERASGPRDARGKAVVAPGVQRPERIAPAAAVRALLLPRLTDAPRTTLRRASARDALLALAPSSIVRRAVPGVALLQDLAHLVGRMPCYWLEMSRRPDEIPGCVEHVLREATSS